MAGSHHWSQVHSRGDGAQAAGRVGELVLAELLAGSPLACEPWAGGEARESRRWAGEEGQPDRRVAWLGWPLTPGRELTRLVSDWFFAPPWGL